MVKIPSALKWLLTRRARLLGEKQRLEERLPALYAQIEAEVAVSQKRLNSCQRRLETAKLHGPGRLKALDADLAAIDASIRLYDVDVDPARISPIRSQSIAQPLY